MKLFKWIALISLLFTLLFAFGAQPTQPYNDQNVKTKIKSVEKINKQQEKVIKQQVKTIKEMKKDIEYFNRVLGNFQDIMEKHEAVIIDNYRNVDVNYNRIKELDKSTVKGIKLIH